MAGGARGRCTGCPVRPGLVLLALLEVSVMGKLCGRRDWRRRVACKRGQVFALTAIGLVAICGMAGFSIDVGSWYRAHRSQQAVADAAALAAADNLPTSTAQAT